MEVAARRRLQVRADPVAERGDEKRERDDEREQAAPTLLIRAPFSVGRKTHGAAEINKRRARTSVRDRTPTRVVNHALHRT